MLSVVLLTFTRRIMTLCTKRRQRAGTISMMRDRPMRLASTAAAAAASARSNSSVIFAQSPLSVGNWAPVPMKHPPSAVHFRRRWRRLDTYDGRPATTTTPRPPHPRPATADVIMADELRLPARCVYRISRKWAGLEEKRSQQTNRIQYIRSLVDAWGEAQHFAVNRDTMLELY